MQKISAEQLDTLVQACKDLLGVDGIPIGMLADLSTLLVKYAKKENKLSERIENLDTSKPLEDWKTQAVDNLGIVGGRKDTFQVGLMGPYNKTQALSIAVWITLLLGISDEDLKEIRDLASSKS